MKWWGPFISGASAVLIAIGIFDVGFILALLIRDRCKVPTMGRYINPKTSHALHGQGQPQEMQPMLPTGAYQPPKLDSALHKAPVVHGHGSMAVIMPVIPLALATSLVAHLAAPAITTQQHAEPTPVPTQVGSGQTVAHGCSGQLQQQRGEPDHHLPSVQIPDPGTHAIGVMARAENLDNGREHLLGDIGHHKHAD